MTSGLRPRQVKAIEDVRAAYRAGFRAPVLVAPTGFGKTHTTAEIVRTSVARGKTVWFMAHLKEILEDTSKKLAAEGIQHGIIMAGIPSNRSVPVQVVSVQTVARRLGRYEKPDLLIIDEAHLAVATTYRAVIDWAGCYLLLLTATPMRLDGRGLNEIADTIIQTCSTQDLIDEKLLADIRYYAPSRPDLSGVRTVAGDYAKNDLAEAVDKPRLIGDAVSHWLKYAKGRQTIAFCCSIKHAQHVAEQFRSVGIRAVAVSGDTDSMERRQALADLKAGRVDVVTNCALWVAGVDAPTVSCIMLLAPTKSLTKYLQSVGRGLRTAPGKTDCIILDHGSLIHTHGHPADLREWSLEGSPKKKRARDPDDISIKSCPVCFRVCRSVVQQCDCGHRFVAKAREIEQVDGVLAEVDRSAVQRAARREQGRAQSLEDLIKLGVSRGYKNPRAWAVHLYNARNHKGA